MERMLTVMLTLCVCVCVSAAQVSQVFLHGAHADGDADPFCVCVFCGDVSVCLLPECPKSPFMEHMLRVMLTLCVCVCAAQVSKSPFVERLLKKGYEVLYLTEPVDEYCIQSLPEFEGKKFQNVAKEGLKLDQSEKAKEYKEKMEKEFEPLLKWLTETALKDKVGGGPGWVEDQGGWRTRVGEGG